MELVQRGGVGILQENTNDDLGKVAEAIKDDALDIEEVINKFEKMHTKAKFKSFGKIIENNEKKKSKKPEIDDYLKDNAKKIIEKQSK